MDRLFDVLFIEQENIQNISGKLGVSSCFSREDSLSAFLFLKG